MVSGPVLERQPPSWAARYIGIPFARRGYSREGLNCWGLVRLIMMEQAGVVLPTYLERYETMDRREWPHISSEMEKDLPEWTLVAAKADNGLLYHRPPHMFDVVLMSVNGRPLHVGIVVAKGAMIHVEEGISSMKESYTEGAWRHRVLGLYRHRELLDD
jgi:cell wall-associated NlpC family hydrolase